LAGNKLDLKGYSHLIPNNSGFKLEGGEQSSFRHFMSSTQRDFNFKPMQKTARIHPHPEHPEIIVSGILLNIDTHL